MVLCFMVPLESWLVLECMRNPTRSLIESRVYPETPISTLGIYGRFLHMYSPILGGRWIWIIGRYWDGTKYWNFQYEKHYGWYYHFNPETTWIGIPLQSWNTWWILGIPSPKNNMAMEMGRFSNHVTQLPGSSCCPGHGRLLRANGCWGHLLPPARHIYHSMGMIVFLPRFGWFVMVNACKCKIHYKDVIQDIYHTLMVSSGGNGEWWI